jgi:DNA-binding CsgD family transcriptional regulator
VTGHGAAAARHGLVGRRAEAERIESWLADVPHGVRGLVIRGEPGIGKTALWRRTLATWEDRGWRVRVARPAEEELTLSMSALADLLERDLGPERGSDPIADGRAVLDVLREDARRGPLLVAIDDLQWLDAASARALRYALRRLDAEPVGVLATMRTTAEHADPLDLTGQWSPARVETVDLGPMTATETRLIVGEVLPTVAPRLLRRLHDASGGNPMFALELARSLRDAGQGRSSVDDVRLPGSLRSAIRSRLSTVPDPVVPLLEAVSALGRTTMSDLSDILPDRDVEDLVLTAERHAILTVADDLEVRFSHAMIGTVVYEGMHPLTRRRVHARLAAHTADTDLRIRHRGLAADAPDRDLAAELAAAAERASLRGEVGLAVELADLSWRLTPEADGQARDLLTPALVRYLAAAGEMARALELADGLVARLPEGAARARAHVVRAQLEDDDVEAGEAHLLQALADAGDDLPLRGQVLDQLGWLRGIFRGDLPEGVAFAREALRIAESCGDAEFEMSAAAGLSNLETLAGSPRPDLMARAVALEDRVGRPPLWSGPRVLWAEQLLWEGDLARARGLLVAAVADADRRGHERWRPYSLYDLAAVEGAAGNLLLADDLLRQAIESARDCEDAHVESWIFYRLALVATWLGRTEEARSAARRRIDAATRGGQRPGVARARSVLGLLALSEGVPSVAADELLTAVRALEEMGFAHPGAIPAVPDAIEALTLAGELTTAEELLAVLAAQAATVGSRWVDAAVVRARGTIALGRGRPEAAGTLTEAAATFDDLGCRPDAARAVLLCGRAHLRAGKRTAAADSLARARGAFVGMGAELWARRAEEELDRVAPGRASGALTPTERRVAVLVADGRRNKEIAQELFMSVATVEAHLTRMFRKLGIGSRNELTRLVATGEVAT